MEKYSHNYGKYELKKQYPSIHSKFERKMKQFSTKDTDEAKEHIEDLLSDWSSGKKVIPELGLQYGYRQDKVQVETQFGNIARYYNDILKMEMAYRKGIINLGILIVPTHERYGKMPANVADFNRVKDELIEMREIIKVPITVYGI